MPIVISLLVGTGCGSKSEAIKAPSLDSPNKEERIQAAEEKKQKWGN
jgi:hypothetical protein